eukprot:EG_transcript_17399
MSLPEVFQRFDLDGPNFSPGHESLLMRTCLGHLNRVTEATFQQHVHSLAQALHLQSGEERAAFIENLADLLFGKVATESKFSKLYACVCRDIDEAEPGLFVDAVLAALVPFVCRPPTPAMSDAEEYRNRMQKAACFGFVGQLFGLGLLPLGLARDLLGNLTAAVDRAASPPAEDPRTRAHAILTLCSFLQKCPTSFFEVFANDLVEVVPMLNKVVEDPDFTSLGMNVYFAVVEALELCSSGGKRRTALPFTLLVDEGRETA